MAGFIKDNFRRSILGGGIPGQANILLGGGGGSNQSTGMSGGNDRSLDRKVLTQAFGNNNYIIKQNYATKMSPLYLNSTNAIPLGPFRSAMNAGDVNATVNQSTDPIYGRPANQVNSLNPGISKQALAGYKGLAGRVSMAGKSAYTGNPTYVYDGSDYIKYKKLAAINRTYNDLSYGGGGNKNTAFVAIKRVRH